MLLLQRGDEIIEVNGLPFTSITHDKAVQILKSNRKMSILASHIGKIPADLTFEPQVKLVEDDIDKCANVLAMIEEKARTVLTKSEHSRFTFYREEYQQGFLPVQSFVRILLELLSTHEKVRKKKYAKKMCPYSYTYMLHSIFILTISPCFHMCQGGEGPW